MALYDQKTACSLLFHKQVRSIGFVGNSLLRNFYSVMLQMLTNNYHNGSVVSCIPPSIRKKCVGYWQVMSNLEKPQLKVCAHLGNCKNNWNYF